MADTVTLDGLEFHVNVIGTNYKNEPGVYAFMALSGSSWAINYIGETESLQDRLTTNLQSHQAYVCAVTRRGSTHLAARIQSGGKQFRLDLEARLRQLYDPPCNRQ